MKTHLRLLFSVAALAAFLSVNVSQAAELSVEWDDNSDNETGFHIERAPGAAPAASAFVRVGSVGANVKIFADGGLPNKTAFTYRVQAFNADTVSVFSGTASGTTPPAPILAPSRARVTVPPQVTKVTVPSGTLLVVETAK